MYYLNLKSAMKLGQFIGTMMDNIFTEFFPRFDRLGPKSRLFSIQKPTTINQRLSKASLWLCAPLQV